MPVPVSPSHNSPVPMFPGTPSHHSPVPMFSGYQTYPSQGYAPPMYGQMNMYGQMKPYDPYQNQMQHPGMYSAAPQNAHVSGPPSGPAAVPATPSTLGGYGYGYMNASGQSQCRLEVMAKAENQSQVMRMMDMTWLDKYFYDRSTPTQVLGFRFSHALDPTRAAHSLKLAIDEYPLVASKVVNYGGQAKFQLDEERVVVQLVRVEPETLKSMKQLVQITNILVPRSPDNKQNPLFHAFLFRCKDAHHGSALVVGFQHCLGDAGSYALFMQKWSQCYQKLSASSSPPSSSALPPEPFRQYHLIDPNFKKNPAGPQLRTFLFSENALKSLKTAAMKGCKKGEILSTNDILCAQCACAVAMSRPDLLLVHVQPFRFRQAQIADVNSLVRIVVLIDFRGLSVPLDTWGNRWSDVAVDLPWAELLTGNVMAVAKRIRAVVAMQKAWMQNDAARFDRERTSRNPHVHKLFTWNSWAKNGELLRTVDFKDVRDNASGQREIKWFNASWLPVPDVVVVEPLVGASKNDPQIAIRVASPRGEAEGELAALKRVWGTAGLDQEN